jgi:hypothetical protein
LTRYGVADQQASTWSSLLLLVVPVVPLGLVEAVVVDTVRRSPVRVLVAVHQLNQYFPSILVLHLR